MTQKSPTSRLFLTVTLFLFINCWTFDLSVAGPRKGKKPGFKVFNTMLYKDMPEFGKRLPIIYESSFFPNKMKTDTGLPTKEGIANAVKDTETQIKGDWKASGDLVIIDIESWHLWPFVTGKEHEKSVGLYRDSAKAFRQKVKRPVCFYSVAPSGGLIHSTLSVTDPKIKADLKAANDVIAREIIPQVDALCPALYTFYDAANPRKNRAEHKRYIKQWKLFASETIKEARRISGGKPVYCFIWPQFHNGGNFKDHRYIPDDYWKEELKTIKKLADGVILWGGWDMQLNQQAKWDEKASWWKITREILGKDAIKTVK